MIRLSSWMWLSVKTNFSLHDVQPCDEAEANLGCQKFESVLSRHLGVVADGPDYLAYYNAELVHAIVDLPHESISINQHVAWKTESSPSFEPERLVKS